MKKVSNDENQELQKIIDDVTSKLIDKSSALTKCKKIIQKQEEKNNRINNKLIKKTEICSALTKQIIFHESLTVNKFPENTQNFKDKISNNPFDFTEKQQKGIFKLMKYSYELGICDGAHKRDKFYSLSID